MVTTKVDYHRISIKFTGNECLKEAYTLHLNDLKDSIMAISTPQELQAMILELSGLLATAKNKQGALATAHMSKRIGE